MEGHRVRRQRSSTTKTKQPEPLERIQPNAAGIDCGSRHHHVAVPVDRDPEPVRRFKTFTPDLYRMVDWLEACRIDTVAMEATGVYWIPIYDILEQRGFKVVLVNARHVKNVPGRKTDVVDCQWIQELHEVGLLRGSFRPSAEIVSGGGDELMGETPSPMFTSRQLVTDVSTPDAQRTCCLRR